MVVRGAAVVREQYITLTAAAQGAIAPTMSAPGRTFKTIGTLPSEVFTKASIAECIAADVKHIIHHAGRAFHHRQVALASAAFNGARSTSLRERTSYSSLRQRSTALTSRPAAASTGSSCWGGSNVGGIASLADDDRQDVVTWRRAPSGSTSRWAWRL